MKTLQKEFPGVAGVVKFSSPLAHLITAGVLLLCPCFQSLGHLCMHVPSRRHHKTALKVLLPRIFSCLDTCFVALGSLIQLDVSVLTRNIHLQGVTPCNWYFETAINC